MKKIKQLAKRERLTKSFFASSLSVFILGLFSPLFFGSSQESVGKKALKKA